MDLASEAIRGFEQGGILIGAVLVHKSRIYLKKIYDVKVLLF